MGRHEVRRANRGMSIRTGPHYAKMVLEEDKKLSEDYALAERMTETRPRGLGELRGLIQVDIKTEDYSIKYRLIYCRTLLLNKRQLDNMCK